tara:strand:+ start:450 stop:3440 length:2991 start_codon:yes stop_codon:yes gene_type:complete
MTVSAEGESIQNEVAYGIEYDWSNLDEDIDSLTGIDLNEILSRTMLAATDAGLTLTVAQLSTGSSNIYVESAEDRTATTIEIGGESHSVWTRATDVTIRHAVLFDSALVTEWIDSSGADPTGFDGYLSVDSENAVAVDVNMVEYFDDDYNLYGVDMDFSLASEVSIEYQMDAGLEGAGEEFDFALTFGTGFDLNVPEATAEWRLGEKAPFFPVVSTYEEVEIECADDAALTTSGSEADLKIECGTLEGDYSVSTGFTFDLSDIPTENFGMDAGLLDISITDEISSTGSWDTDMEDFMESDDDHHETEEDEGHHHHGDGDYHHDHDDGSDGHTHDEDDRHHDHDDDDSDDDDSENDGYGGDPDASIIIAEGGSPVDVVNCECGTANPLMFLMLAAMLTNIGEAFAEDAAEELGDTFEEEFSEAVEGIGEALGGSEEDDDDDDDYSEWFTCADGMEIDEYREDDSNNDCGDWSDETKYDTFYPCDDILTSMEGVQLYEVNNGMDDCSDESDENVLWLQHVGLDIQTMYECADGSRDVSEWSIGNGWEECDDGSDEWPLAEETLTSTETMNVGSNGYADRDTVAAVDTYCYIAGMTVTDSDDGSTIFDGNMLMSSPGSGYVNGHAGEDIGPYDGTREFSSSGHINQYTLPAGLTSCEELTQAQIDNMDEFSPEYVATSNVVTHDGSLKRMLSHGYAHQTDGEVEFDMWFDGVHMDDEEYTLEVVIWTDDDEMIGTESVDIDSDDSHASGGINDDGMDPGDYCVEFTLVDSSGATVDTYDSDDDDGLCMTVEEVPEWLMELGAILEAFGESDFEDTLEDFGSNLEDRLGGITEDIAYTDSLFIMWWSPTHHTVVGTSLVVQDNMETWYTLVGPQISEVYTDEVTVDTGAAPATIGLNYLIGDAASSAAVEMEDAQSVDEIADTAAHAADMGEFAQVLEDAGVDPASIGIDPVEDVPAEPETAEEMIDEGIFGLPSVSGLATIAILALAGIVVAQRNRDEE